MKTRPSPRTFASARGWISLDLEVDEVGHHGSIEAVLVVARGRLIGGDDDDRRDAMRGDLCVERDVDFPARVVEAAVVVVPDVHAVVHEQHGILRSLGAS